MHKCINNSDANVSHLEQFVSNFFPYSQKQLRFDKPVTIKFESDNDNAAILLGKTAYYDPQNYEIALYIDDRHPKDIMRSLSHELVHHAQNCRGDFGRCAAAGWELGSANGNAVCAKDTDVGYAQRDPRLRKMEREAYTKGNLIFRDFEDLVKTGKIEVHIDFKISGEPKMSLQEWKNNEINQKLMKKWGLLTEDKGSECKPGFEWQDGECVELQQESEEEKGGVEGIESLTTTGLREGCPSEEGGDAIDISAPGAEVHVGDISELSPEEAFAAGMVAARDAIESAIGGGGPLEEGELEESTYWRDDEEDPAAEEVVPLKGAPPKATSQDPEWYDDPGGGIRGSFSSKESGRHQQTRAGLGAARKKAHPQSRQESISRKISVREAKELTRRVIERIKMENK